MTRKMTHEKSESLGLSHHGHVGRGFEHDVLLVPVVPVDLRRPSMTIRYTKNFRDS